MMRGTPHKLEAIQTVAVGVDDPSITAEVDSKLMNFCQAFVCISQPIIYSKTLERVCQAYPCQRAFLPGSD